MGSGVKLSVFERYLRGSVQHFNQEKYWKRRFQVVNPSSRLPRLLKYYYLYYIKRCDAFNNASLGTHIGYGAEFASRPSMPHGLYGIIVSHNAKIGKNCTIYHQTTIGEGTYGAPRIGDNVVIGAGAKLFGKIRIGDNAQIGGGAVVTFDVPDNCVVKAAKGTVCYPKDSE